MAEINHVVLVGRLTRNAELKYTNAGAAVSKFGLAINQRRKKDDQPHEQDFKDGIKDDELGDDRGLEDEHDREKIDGQEARLEQSMNEETDVFHFGLI
jgi:hypothetical protein